MKPVSISEAKNTLSALLKKVRGGARITITDRGVPVAQLVPPPSTKGIPPHMIELARRGVIKLAEREDPEWWKGPLVRPRGELDNAAVDALIEERRTGW